MVIPVQDLIDQAAVMSVPVRNDLSGILVMCIPLEKLAADTGLYELFTDQRLALLSGESQQNDFLNDPDGLKVL